MKKTSIEKRFSLEIDNYFDGVKETNKLGNEEYNGLLELGKTLADKDFSRNSNKKVVFNKALRNINKFKEDNITRKCKKNKRPINLVASFVLVSIISISLMQTSFAQEFIEKIIKSISLGHIRIIQEEPSSSQAKEFLVPYELKGRVFDEEGKPIPAEESFVDYTGISIVFKDSSKKIYTAAGERIVGFSDGQIVTEKMRQKEREEKILEITNPNELNKYTCFNVILPSYLPEGYKFSKAEFYKDEKGNVSSKYVNLYFTNEKAENYIYMQQRFADEETSYEMGVEKLEQVKINGFDAIITEDSSIDWEANGVLYGLHGRRYITKSELMKIAESIK
ncbi:DUF4367 domain-containing protein [Wukongibacter sp. M2B1]|uniref:DUF4367 domain-containing protein n=1 Tax=Wukongibacter sp. M2B1 TaxID=3088895 RepID=UPI003D7B2FCA